MNTKKNSPLRTQSLLINENGGIGSNDDEKGIGNNDDKNGKTTSPERADVGSKDKLAGADQEMDGEGCVEIWKEQDAQPCKTTTKLADEGWEMSGEEYEKDWE